MGGGEQIQQQENVPADAQGVRGDLSSLLQNLLGGIQQSQLGVPGSPGQTQGFQNPIFQPFDPIVNTGFRQLEGVLQGQFDPTTPAGAAGQGLQNQIQGTGGFAFDKDVFSNDAVRNFQRTIAPGLQSQVGANFGVRNGTPIADILSRSAGDVALSATAEGERIQQGQVNPLRAQGIQLGLGLPGAAATLGFGAQNQQQNAFAQLLQFILGGSGILNQSQFSTPQFAPSSAQQALNAAAPVAGALAAR